MRYEKFKEFEKTDFKTNKNGILEIQKINPESSIEIDKIKKSDKITLTKKDNKQRDFLVISSYDENNITNTVFNFNVFDFVENRFYNVKIENLKTSRKFLQKLKGIESEKFWKIIIEEIKENGIFLKSIHETNKKSSEDSEIKSILENNKIKIEDKILNLIKFYKYNRIKEIYTNKKLFN